MVSMFTSRRENKYLYEKNVQLEFSPLPLCSTTSIPHNFLISTENVGGFLLLIFSHWTSSPKQRTSEEIRRSWSSDIDDRGSIVMSKPSMHAFRWSEREFSLKEVVADYRQLVPFALLVTQGYSGHDDLTSSSTNEVCLLWSKHDNNWNRKKKHLVCRYNTFVFALKANPHTVDRLNLAAEKMGDFVILNILVT